MTANGLVAAQSCTRASHLIEVMTIDKLARIPGHEAAERDHVLRELQRLLAAHERAPRPRAIRVRPVRD
jgi:hypothetical protein